MSSEKTEAPTHKKLKDARKKGQVAKSIEATAGIQLAYVLAWFIVMGKDMFDDLNSLIHLSVEQVNRDITTGANTITMAMLWVMAKYLGTLAGGLVICTVSIILAQTGFVIASRSVGIKLDKLNIASNAKQMFSLKSFFDFFKSIVKIIILGFIFLLVLKGNVYSLQYVTQCGVSCAIPITVRMLFWLWVYLLFFYLVLFIADYAFQKYSTLKQLKMSKEEIKQEYKQSEGNPEMKGHRRAIHREIQSGSLSSQVKRSSVVVRNPTHYAVCIYYQPDVTPLPQVIAKGEGGLAITIISIAEKSGIPIIENIPLARGLFKETDVNDYISTRYFEPVAEIIRVLLPSTPFQN